MIPAVWLVMLGWGREDGRENEINQNKMLWAILLCYRAKHWIPSSFISWLTCSPQTTCKDTMFDEWHYKKPFQFSSSPFLSSAPKSYNDVTTAVSVCQFLAFSTPCGLFLHKSQERCLTKFFNLKQWNSLDDISYWAAADKELGVFSPQNGVTHSSYQTQINSTPTLTSLLGEMRVLGAQNQHQNGCAWFCVLPAWQCQQ